MKRVRILVWCSSVAAATTLTVLTSLTVRAAPDGGPASIAAGDLKEWLTYIASDDLQGRAVYSAGLGLAAGYIGEHLRAWGVTPAGDVGSYLQTVRVLGVKATSHSTVIVQVGNETRTFDDGDAILFPKNAGARRRLTVNRVEFTGYGLGLPPEKQRDGRARVDGAAVIWLGADGPKDVDGQKYRLLLLQRNRYAVEEGHAAASIGPEGATGGEARAVALPRLTPADLAAPGGEAAAYPLPTSRPPNDWTNRCRPPFKRRMRFSSSSSAARPRTTMS